MRWLVDGYNVIRRAPKLASRERESLEAGRRALCALLADVARYSPDTFTVVFDGAETGGHCRRRRRHGDLLQRARISRSRAGEDGARGRRGGVQRPRGAQTRGAGGRHRGHHRSVPCEDRARSASAARGGDRRGVTQGGGRRARARPSQGGQSAAAQQEAAGSEASARPARSGSLLTERALLAPRRAEAGLAPFPAFVDQPSAPLEVAVANGAVEVDRRLLDALEEIEVERAIVHRVTQLH